jgi:hypothetical protein
MRRGPKIVEAAGMAESGRINSMPMCSCINDRPNADVGAIAGTCGPILASVRISFMGAGLHYIHFLKNRYSKERTYLLTNPRNSLSCHCGDELGLGGLG